jgi:transglutaminase-like putative cysteine protease
VRVAVSHLTRLDYSADVTDGVMDVRLGPLSDDHQRWLRFDLAGAPNAAVNRYVDGFGNVAHLVSLRWPHRQFEVVSHGEVETLLDDPFALPSAAPAPLTVAERADYLMPSPLVSADPHLADMAAPFRPTTPEGIFEAVQALTSLVHREFAYEQQHTDVSTSVEQVLEARRGVCQDFAHVLIGLCRAAGVPARYVSGYIASVEARQSQRLGDMHQSQSLRLGQPRGAEASHAWAEAFTPTHGWRGFDPTNNLVASTHHVKMAIGRDYRDVSPTRGAYRGTAEEHLTVVVSVHPAD